jgi:hypothetical protein
MLAAVKGLSLPNDIVMQTIHKLEKHQKKQLHRCIGTFWLVENLNWLL